MGRVPGGWPGEGSQDGSPFRHTHEKLALAGAGVWAEPVRIRHDDARPGARGGRGAYERGRGRAAYDCRHGAASHVGNDWQPARSASVWIQGALRRSRGRCRGAVFLRAMLRRRELHRGGQDQRVRARAGEFPFTFWIRIRRYRDALSGIGRSAQASASSDAVVFHRTTTVWTGIRKCWPGISGRRRAVVCRSIYRLGIAGGRAIGSHGWKGSRDRTACGGIPARMPGEPAATVSGRRSVAQGTGRRMGGKALAARSRSATVCSHPSEVNLRLRVQMKKAGEYSEEDTHRPACH